MTTKVDQTRFLLSHVAKQKVLDLIMLLVSIINLELSRGTIRIKVCFMTTVKLVNDGSNGLLDLVFQDLCGIIDDVDRYSLL